MCRRLLAKLINIRDKLQNAMNQKSIMLLREAIHKGNSVRFRIRLMDEAERLLRWLEEEQRISSRLKELESQDARKCFNELEVKKSVMCKVL